MRTYLGLLALLAASLSPEPVRAQGIGVQYLNFEAPSHDPMDVVTVGTNVYLLVCNVADNSVEVYDTATNAFVFRIPVGQMPVTIVTAPRGSGTRAWVANWLGDSITSIELTAVTGTPPIAWKVLRTEPVGDEPVGIAVLPVNPNDVNTQVGGVFHQNLMVTFSAQHRWGWFHPDTLQGIAPGLTERIELMHAASPSYTAIRDPRAIAFAPPPSGGGNYADQMWILNFRGGNDPAEYDLDLWGTNNLVTAVTTGADNLPPHGQLGTTNFDMAFAPNGELYVVGTRALNKALVDTNGDGDIEGEVGEPQFQGMVTGSTGFVTSFLARYRNLSNAAAVPDFLDLNDQNQGSGTVVQATTAITQPTDVLVYGSGAAGATRIFVPGFNSDTLAMVQPTAGAPATWTVTRVDLSHPTNPFHSLNLGGVMRGPRALAARASGTPNDPSDRLYVYNRLENTVTVCNPNFVPPASPVITTFNLQFQVEPAHVTTGRKFLYASKLSGGNNVSCASCHVDGNSDFIAWNLSGGVAVPPPGSAGSLPGALGPNGAIKGPMVTQPLRGMVNFEVENNTMQDLFFSNRPYHWRGDKGFLEQFNAAFVNLMAMPNPFFLHPSNGDLNQGLPPTEMNQCRDFMFSIHYPPNPNQPWDRRYSGTPFDPANPPTNAAQEIAQLNDPNVGTRGQLGLKAFHIVPSDVPAGSSCVHCHTLPEGSNNLLTEAFFHSESADVSLNFLETAQLKGLELKNKRLIRADPTTGSFQALPSLASLAVNHEFGLVHTGRNTLSAAPGNGMPSAIDSRSINHFVAFFGLNATLSDAISNYVLEFDSGVGPLVGFTATADYALYNSNPTGISAALASLEAQVERANAGLAIHARLGGVMRGFWYDVTDAATPYHEEPRTGLATIGPFSRAGLLAFLDATSGISNPDNILSSHFTPLGNERRTARLDGGLASALTAGAPTGITLLPCMPNTANADVPRMTVDWANLVNGFQFVNSLNTAGLTNQVSVMWYQKSLINHAGLATPPNFGMTALRHETPRRFRVSGTGIRQGAMLLLYAPSAGDVGPSTVSSPPTTTPNPASNPYYFLLPLYPARDAGQLVWETAVEMEPLFLLGLMNGGPANAQAVAAYFNPTAAPFLTQPLGSVTSYPIDTPGNDIMLPRQWNWYYVQVVNEPLSLATLGTGGWQRLTIQ